jgi:predicted heme/steroid binding protein/predicted small secreted protein
MRKKALILAVFAVVVTGILLAGCGGNNTQGTTSSSSNQQSNQGGQTSGKTFTLEELAQYNGKNGQPAYVAVDGVVYDVTGSSMWSQGVHSSCSPNTTAGNDLSEIMKQAPARMRDNLKKFPVVGTLQ